MVTWGGAERSGVVGGMMMRLRGLWVVARMLMMIAGSDVAVLQSLGLTVVVDWDEIVLVS
jgi:hypothetical protein